MGDKVDVLVLIVGHAHGKLLKDSGDAVAHYHTDCRSTYRVAYAIDNNEACRDYLAEFFGEDYVYNTPENNGWGRGILRTIVHALEYFRERGVQFDHLLTCDSDALVVGPCLDRYVELTKGHRVCFVGTKWGGVSDISLTTPSNPAPTDDDLKAHVHFARRTGIIKGRSWQPLNYLAAGPFVLWTRYCLEFMAEIGLLPADRFEEYYPHIQCPHDQMTSFILGVEGHQFADVGSLAMLYCGNVGGYSSWKNGFPYLVVPPYGKVPDVPPGVGVIHPIRAKIYDEAMVRIYFRKIREKKLTQAQLPRNLFGDLHV